MTTTTDDVTYWAISSIGYGSGDTPEKAFKVYIDSQVRNFSHLSREEILEGARGQVMRAPQEATGFVIGYEDHWTKDGDPLQDFDYPNEVVAWIGALPPWAERDDLDDERKRMATLPVLR